MADEQFQYVTVVETRAFLSAVSRTMTEADREEFVTFIAANPQRGYLIPGTGGIRKIRWGIKGQGKSGGLRVIYYYHSESHAALSAHGLWEKRKERFSRVGKSGHASFGPGA